MTESEFDEPHTCPRCGGGIPNNRAIGAYPGAVSRWDSATEVCSQCGMDEAFLQMLAEPRDGVIVIHPVQGMHPWVRVPRPLQT